MGLKEAGLRGSLRSVSAGVPVIPDSVVWQTPYNEGSGDTVSDIIGSADGTISGATWISSSDTVGDSYLDFDGVDDSVHYGNPPVLDLDPQGTWTVEIPLRATLDDSVQTIMGKTVTNTGDRQYQFRITSDGYGTIVGGNFENTTVAPSGNWEIMYVRNNAGSVDLLIDTAEIITELSAGTGTNNEDVYIGRWSHSDDNHFSGDVDSPVVHDTALSDSEISDRVSAYPNWI